MNIQKINNLIKGQDGAIFGNLLFRFTTKGECSVYDLETITQTVPAEPVSQFTLDKADLIVPHSNVVLFGTEYFSPEDEFPLLYSNIYNNYAKTDDKRKGITCVYRLRRNGSTFQTTLVQLIEIGFVEDPLWRSENATDVRPYGNFAIDRDQNLYYAFVMRDQAQVTRFFAFDLPKLAEGEEDPRYGVRRVVLQPEQILRQFDCPYAHYVQGACVHNGRIYSLEGFTESEPNPPAMRIIDTAAGCQIAHIAFGDFGMTVEPELIDFVGDTCWYCDCHGNLYTIAF